jgi:hypothetical protein
MKRREFSVAAGHDEMGFPLHSCNFASVGQPDVRLLYRLGKRSYRFSSVATSLALSFSHAMAGKYFLAALAQSGPVLLQALLNRSIVAQLLSAKALRISCAGPLLLWRAHVTLRKG